jgi:hypothetical protein
MGDLASRLDETVSRLRGWGIRVIDASRLTKSVSQLRTVADVGSFPTSDSDLVRVAHAVRDAQEFFEIADVLPESALKPLAVDLQQAVGGTLGVGGNAAAQFQSQLWVGAMLVWAGARTAMLLNAEGKRPDFVVENGVSLYPVEVKPPSGKINAPHLVSEATRQIAAVKRGHGGAIIVDLTDCMPGHLSVEFGHGPRGDGADKRVIQKPARPIHNEIFDTALGQIKPNRRMVFVLLTFARYAYWNRDDLTRPYVGKYVASVVYWRHHPNTLAAHRARWLAGLIDKGIRAAGHGASELEQLDL